jgi:protein-S-isoprenylcysteine O-methyltransferase Ste14
MLPFVPSVSRLLLTAATRWVLGAATLGVLLFLPAGSWDYWQAWAYLATLFTPMTFVLVYLLRHDPELLERRLKAKEPVAAQRLAVSLGGVGILGSLLVAGLDQRFGWSHVPVAVVVAALVVVLLGYGLFFLVLRENSYAARVVEVAEGQRVISTGPYGVVRHPMYVAVILMFLATPVALGSWWALVPAALLLPGMVLRTLDEEAQLRTGLPGYAEYCAKVRHRLIPGVW